ncbi:hypothetical protein P5673_012655 [Acropora cervicornis]|uniref:Uncharacterized protein n=1 Tax=Acropora cervicornis TaxID=6130 RepID=A0AAD9QLU8_ACRCE|nr:hypothetical protein P5673_012655 [Acropora cervicornis]
MSDENSSLIYSLAYTGCFKKFNVASCVRDSSLTLLAIITCFVCVFKLYKLHSHRHSLPNQYIIFYSGIAECLLCGINWFYLATTAVFLVTQFIKVSQFLIIANFHCRLAARMMGMDEKFRRFSNKVYGAVFILLLTITVAGLALMKIEFKECAALMFFITDNNMRSTPFLFFTEPEWLLLSSLEIFIVQVFMAVGIFITRELNSVRMLADDRTAQKRDLWGIIFILELSALTSLVHDIVMKISKYLCKVVFIKKELLFDYANACMTLAFSWQQLRTLSNQLVLAGPKNHCQGIFLKTKAGYTAVYIAVNIIRWLLPLWSMAAIFDTENNRPTQYDYIPPVFAVNDNSGNFTSEFRPRRDSFHYKHLHDDIGGAGRPLLPPLSSPSKTLSSMGSSYGSTMPQGSRSLSDRYPPIA